ncbi:hypothetical protein PILCRDRAFT_14903 [Piloderma croceum F 1598]|uniref:Retrotransposon gag domain-containing protein n=1 Tax=Piloderma croceum (strain F 1598) TaxID=765440 RepID=A0A0C3F0Z2_PILCF|nr:hypothetical protein PILCRDRAFT_14903 [Piloderma croceum F 1598]
MLLILTLLTVVITLFYFQPTFHYRSVPCFGEPLQRERRFKSRHPLITEDYSLDQPLQHLEQQLLEDLLDASNLDNNHHRLLSLEFDHLQTRSTLFSLPDVPHSDPFLLLELICEAPLAEEEETILYLRENPVGTYLTETPHDKLPVYLGHPTTPQNPFVPSRYLFGIEFEPRRERTFAELSRTPILLSPLVELLTIEEDISCDHATTDLLDTLANLGDLFPIIKEVPSLTASPTPSTLFIVEEPVGPLQDQIMVRTKSGRGTTSEENTSSWESQNPQEGQYSEPEYEYRSEPDLERPEFEQGPSGSHRSYDPPSDDEEEEIPEGLALSTHPFYRGHQYPPPPPLVPPEDIKLPPSLPSTSSTSSSSMAAVVPPPTPKEKGHRPDPFTQKSGYEKFRQQLSLFFRMNEEVYSTNLEKVYFALSLMTEGTPGQWAQNFIEKVEARATAGVIPEAAWGTWTEFAAALKASFADPNKGKNSYNALEELTYSPGRSADKFLQEFETLAGCAGYMGATPNDAHLIVLLEQKVPLRLLDKVYNDVVPTTYADYKEKIIRYDNLSQKLKAIAPKRYGKIRFISNSGTTYCQRLAARGVALRSSLSTKLIPF